MANIEFWDERYDTDEFVYGTAPNAFLANAVMDYFPSPPATILDLGAGEGRTAVFLATRGYDVVAVDASAVGLRKANQLASKHGVQIATEEKDITEWQDEERFDGIVCSFLHFAPADRPRLYRMMQRAVRPGGIVAAEWFRPEQRTEGYTSGGPPHVELMIDKAELRANFPEEGLLLLEDASPMLEEGDHHSGPGATVRLVWRKG
ncbi:SAM-dependent methyltransferase [Longibacter salinarum]|uniref:SAM-dependent methyltransferase n=1 Tax=Longibacter salinarum TaxID=1850348 RepID=A0A2A8CYN6_9BACT|nr:class I SAM-dependent methyltransferase [Longibacter salinarum]PEN13805.1 SAM-dependent methyltransferase [Longibacter salinarum]